MLKIRTAQLEALGAARAEQYYRELAAGLKTSGRPDLISLSDDARLARLMEHVKRAESYGIVGRGPLRGLARLIGRHGFDFDLSNPQVLSILQSGDKGSAEKLDAVYQLLSTEGQ